MSGIDNVVSGEFSVRPLHTVEDLIGNEEAMTRALRILRWQGVPPRMALFGPSGSGKSTTINYECTLAHCHQSTGNIACGMCKGCERVKVGHRETGIFAYALDYERPI